MGCNYLTKSFWYGPSVSNTFRSRVIKISLNKPPRACAIMEQFYLRMSAVYLFTIAMVADPVFFKLKTAAVIHLLKVRRSVSCSSLEDVQK